MESFTQDEMQTRAISCLLSLNRISLQLTFENSGLDILGFAEKVMVPVLDILGNRWQQGELSLAQVYMASRLCEQLMDETVSANQIIPEEHGIAIAVLEDFHVLGKRLVTSVLKASGYGFVDYGQQSLDDLFERTMADNVKILLVSTLMLDSALRIKILKERFKGAGNEVKIVVGGAPFRFDPGLYLEVGADATSKTASGVVAILDNLTGREACHGRA